MQRVDPFVPTTTLAERIRDGDVAPSDAVATYLDRISRDNDDLNAFITVTDESARRAAEQADRAVDDPEEALGPLHGVPIALKDLENPKAGVRNTLGCVPFADAVAERTATTVQRFEKAGAIVLGMTNVPELGHAAVTDNELLGPTATPFDGDRNAGGSSGGSAAAVAAGMTSAAIGSDAGGSVRIPASFCGIYGLKPSFGLVPLDTRPNAFEKSVHHDVKGPLTRTVADAAQVMDVLAGYDSTDPDSLPFEMDFLGAVNRSITDLRIGYSPDLGVFDVDPAVQSVVEDSLSALVDTGATVEEISLDHGLTADELKDAFLTTWAVHLRSITRNIEQHAEIDFSQRRDELSDSLIELLDIAADRGVDDLADTGIVRTRMFDAIQSVFEAYDLLVTPTTGTTAPDLRPTHDHWDWVARRLLTWPFNWTDHPAGTVPAGTDDESAPVGTQLVGPRFGDETVLAASAAFERERPWQYLYE